MMRILLSYDASPGAEQAAALVRATAWPSGSVVRVVAVMEPSATLVPALPMTATRLVPSPEIESQIFAYLETSLRRVVEELRAAGLEADGAVQRGRPASVVVDEAQRMGADVVVAGSRGHGPIASLVLGSVSAELVDQAQSPVLVARKSTLERVLFATDRSSSASDAEALLSSWPIFRNAVVRVVSVAEVVRPWHTGIAPTMYRQVMESYARDLDVAKSQSAAIAGDAADRLRKAGLTADHVSRVGDAAAEIVDEASTWSADLVVLGSRGLTGLKRVVLGSVARNVLQGSEASVLIVRGAPAASGDAAK
jgi:nucleotide-binding universal stress UspA family protein